MGFKEWQPESQLGCLAIVGLCGVIGSCTAFKTVGIGGVDAYSRGSRSGTVVKLSERGLIWKTWEGELAVGAVRNESSKNGTTAVPVVFEFSVTDQAVVDALLAAMDTGESVTIDYGQPYVMPWRDGSSGTYAIAVRKHGPKD